MLDPDISTAAALHHLSRPIDTDDPLAVDRRRFLQLVGMGVGAGLVAGPGTSLLDMAIPGLDPSAWAAGPIGPNDGILVIIGMYGGNDGLNTVVPINDPLYEVQHQPLVISPADTIRLDGNTGLNQHLPVFKQFWDAGQLAIVEGVGHPHAGFSHFACMADWMAGKKHGHGVNDTGWIGRWLDAYLGGSKDLFAAAEIGNSLPLMMIGHSKVGTTVPVGKPRFGVAENANQQKFLNAIRDLGGIGGASTWVGKVGRAQADQLDVAATLNPLVPDAEDLPQPEIVSKLDIAARLINANLGLRVVTTGWGDFDSHAGQPEMHDARMVELNAALSQFFTRLHPAWGSRVTVMTYSEFGRTSWANDGLGTDHGTSAPQFVFGSNVKGGWYGQRPSLANLKRWDRMPIHVHNVDYYGSVVEDWLGGDAAATLPGYHENLGLFAKGPSPDPSFPGLLLGEYVAMNPKRIFDSRNDTGGSAMRIGPNQTVKIKIAGANGVPASDVRAVAVNIGSIRPTESGTYLTAYPTGQAKPLVATVSPRVGAVVPNMSIVGVGSDGTISLYNYSGEVHVTVDLMGYFRKDAAARVEPLTPARILDTRPDERMRAGQRIDLKVTGRGGVPSSGVDAVILNLASVKPTTDGWITAWPKGEKKPFVANLSYLRGDIVPNMVMCKVGDDGRISLDASSGDLDLVADVVACFTSTGGALAPVTPSRLLDTRKGIGAPEAKVGPEGTVELQVTGRAGIPSNARAVVMNVTGIKPDERTYLTIYPTGVKRPVAASLNPGAGAITGNLVVAKVGDGGRVSIFNERSSLHLTADVTGFFL